jgi:hypothetical protein
MRDRQVRQGYSMFAYLLAMELLLLSSLNLAPLRHISSLARKLTVYIDLEGGKIYFDSPFSSPRPHLKIPNSFPHPNQTYPTPHNTKCTPHSPSFYLLVSPLSPPRHQFNLEMSLPARRKLLPRK